MASTGVILGAVLGVIVIALVVAIVLVIVLAEGDSASPTPATPASVVPISSVSPTII